MSSPAILLSGEYGEYAIRNVGHEQPVGALATGIPTEQLLHLKLQWHVRHIKDHLYILSIRSYPAMARDDLVWGYVEPGVEDEWIIQQRAEGINEYTILEAGHSGKGWTLEDKEKQVSLAVVIAQPSHPPVINHKWLWSFQQIALEHI